MTGSLLETLKSINRIIQSDSKDTTYKFALLRAAIESIQERTPFVKIDRDYVELPLGHLVLKWMEYYYPIVDQNLPQKNGDQISRKSLAFRNLLKEVTEFYSTNNRNGISQFFNELLLGKIDDQIVSTVFELTKKLKDTIVKMPMRHIAVSVYGEEYYVFKKCNSVKIQKPLTLSRLFILENYGTYLLRRDYYDAFEVLAGIITGNNSILINWAQFTSEKSVGKYRMSEVLETLNISPVTKRESKTASDLLHKISKTKQLKCVWTGEVLTERYHIEHLLPFHIWKNNDLWNLLPSTTQINGKKSDKIPTKKLILQRKDQIIFYWEAYRNLEPTLFNYQAGSSLIKPRFLNQENWQKQGINSLIEKCEYLISRRGFSPWEHLYE